MCPGHMSGAPARNLPALMRWPQRYEAGVNSKARHAGAGAVIVPADGQRGFTPIRFEAVVRLNCSRLMRY
jgi:hypothetical protein